MPIEVRPHETFADRVHDRVLALQKSAKPLIFERCEPESSLNLIVREFHYEGKGRDVLVRVKLQAAAMVGLLQAMTQLPSIQVTQSFDNDFSGSFRSHELQKKRFEAFQAGTGHRAAPPCHSWHEAGLAVDLFNPPEEERAAMKAAGFFDFLPEDPPHFSFHVDTRTNEVHD